VSGFVADPGPLLPKYGIDSNAPASDRNMDIIPQFKRRSLLDISFDSSLLPAWPRLLATCVASHIFSYSF